MVKVVNLGGGEFSLFYYDRLILTGKEREILDFGAELFNSLYSANVSKPTVWFEAEYYGLTIWKHDSNEGWVSCGVDLDGNLEAEHMLSMTQTDVNSWVTDEKDIKKI